MGLFKETIARSRINFTKSMTERFSEPFRGYKHIAIKLWEFLFIENRLRGYEKSAERRKKKISPRKMSTGEWALYNAAEFVKAEIRRITIAQKYGMILSAREAGDTSTGCSLSQAFATVNLSTNNLKILCKNSKEVSPKSWSNAPTVTLSDVGDVEEGDVTSPCSPDTRIPP